MVYFANFLGYFSILYRLKWSEEEDKKLAGLVARGMNYVQASHAIGRPADSVKHRLNVLKAKGAVAETANCFTEPWSESARLCLFS